ncbi:fumarylacetoacetate hydrolase family protein [Paenibacillus lemnae]|uniref:Fumarylacetoacetate hydrolase family protein n=1 Tax=Paenibacillus lemnae TaxID=1330551 RepID=A0A848M470_PAELE|nr:fumarylacetoacetate hydrolase family protein [Paenibacillus lemnae]NMO95396.1 fumarylacetoacetate hydrolase family protein [Paenibacillus lemnae]
MIEPVRNVYCVGRNYRLHAAELGNAVPEEPMIFLKPTHAVALMDGSRLALPQDRGSLHFEGEIVIRIAKSYEAGMSVDELVDAMSLGIDFTLRDVQSVIKEKGHPWTAAKGFKNAAPLAPWIPFPGNKAVKETPFTVLKNGSQVQWGKASDMIFSLQEIVDYVGRHYGLAEGDIIFTGTPEGVGPAEAGDNFELFWNEKSMGSCMIG